MQRLQGIPNGLLSLAHDDFALLVNAQARGFTKAMRAGVFDAIPRRQLFFSYSLEESERNLLEILKRGFQAVFVCGGDGSLSRLLNDLRALVPDPREQPYVGVLRMGTGNAVADFLGCGAARDDLEKLRTQALMQRASLRLIETAGQLCPFAGCGVDARVLNDYIALKQGMSGTPMEAALTGVRGYLLSGIFKTAPQMLLPSNQRRCFVINEGSRAFAIDRHGRVLEVFEPGAVLYSGNVLMAAVGSVPYYGYKLRMFPHAASRPALFQLRIGMMNPLLSVARLPKLWRGELDREHGIYDFLVDKVRIEFDADTAFQLGGDAMGYRREVLFELAQRRFDFVRPLSKAV
ncbi:MAG: diacylglycerol kinase family protein [Myxococcota bacterium]|jgi:diacylglycerol kinase family enzyme|nr:diacylglycerol kinase family protein [Myxococcota bacterium]